MYLSKGMIVFGLIIMIMGSLAVDAEDISYGAIQRGSAAGCSSKHPNECHDTPANPYNRGCEHSNRCRGKRE